MLKTTLLTKNYISENIFNDESFHQISYLL